MVQTRGPSKRKPTARKDDDADVVGPKGSNTSTANSEISTPSKASKTKTPTKTSRVTKTTPTKVRKSPTIRKVSGTKTAPAASTAAVGVSSEIQLSKITEQEILSANNAGNLVDLINQLTSTSQDEIFNSYKLKTKMKLDQDQATIESLEEELRAKDQIIEDLKRSSGSSLNLPLKPQTKEDSTDLFISPIRKRRNLDEEIINRDDITKELNTVGVILDMIQLLTGLKVINHEQDESNFYFDVIQNSTNDRTEKIVIEYRLVIVKKLSSATEVNYIPTFLETETKQREILKKYLPEYFCDDLTFPYKALSQFYGKMNKALNKITNR